MKESRADLVIHPIRLRILQAVLTGGKMTTQQLAEDLPDIPHATLYRHINKLASGGILKVVEENRIRGAVERVYALVDDGADANADLLNASREDHMRYFTTYVAGLIDAYDRYLRQDKVDLKADLVSYRAASLYLTSEEALTLLQAIAAPIREAMTNGPGPGRRKRTLANVFIPEPEFVSAPSPEATSEKPGPREDA